MGRSSRSAGCFFFAFALLVAGCDRSGPTAREDESACAGGNAPSCERRLNRMKAACEARDVKACVDTADAYSTPAYAPKDDKQAAVYFEKACELNDGRSCGMLARQVAVGRGVAPDSTRALALQDKACRLRYPDACQELAQCLERGDVTRGCKAPDLARARELFQRLCEIKGDHDACDDVARVDKLLGR